MTRSKFQDREPPTHEGDTSPQGSLGAWLRRQREARGVTLRDIADASKISLRYLEALEQDRFDVLPAPVFVKGFLREYTRFVGLDPDEAINLYLLAGREREPKRVEEPQPSPARRPAAPSTWGYGLLLALAVVLFIGVAAAISFYASRQREAPSPPPEAIATYAAPPRLEPEPEPSPVPAATPTATPASAAPAPLRVTLEFSEDCWVEMVVDGRRRASELRASGETLQLEADESVVLTLGNASGVRVEVDGRAFPLPVNSARVVRDLRIDRAALAGAGAAG
jgi:cytoskeletal protein RodZ